MVGVGVLARQCGEQRCGERDQDEQEDDEGRGGGGALGAQPLPEQPGPGGGGDGPRRPRLPDRKCFGHGYLTATWETSRTPVQSLMTMFLTSSPYSRL